MALTCPPLRLVEPDPSALETDAGFWRIYDESFRPWLREPRQVIVDSVREGVGLAIAATDGDRTVGLATFHLLEEPAVLFLVYLAVDPALRGQRLGGELLERSIERGLAILRSRGADPLGTIWEADDPALATTETQRIRRERRIAFFQRHGATLLDTPYRQPPLIEGTAALPMRLLFRPAGGALPDEAAIRSTIRNLYLQKYGDLNGLDRGLLEKLLEEDGFIPSR